MLQNFIAAENGRYGRLLCVGLVSKAEYLLHSMHYG